MRGHPRDQLAQAQRFGHVVVGANLQGHDRVDLVGPRAHHDHRHRGVHLSQLAADVEAGGVGQRDLEQDHAWSSALDLTQRFRPGISLDDLVAVLLADLLDLAARGGVRLHDQHPARRIRHSHIPILKYLKDC